MLTRPVPEFGEGFRLRWGGGKKIVLINGAEEVDSIPLKKTTFFHAAQAIEKFRHRLNKVCTG